MIINNINDLCKYREAVDTDMLKHDIYKYTDCGAWISWDEKSVSVGSIVEGSDAEFYDRFYYPFESDDLDAWIDELEILCDEAWHEAND